MKTNPLLKTFLMIAVLALNQWVFAVPDANPGMWIARDEDGPGPFIKPTPNLVFQGSPNLYAFVANDPINAIDLFGLWPTEIHNEIIETAFPDLSPHERQILEDTSANMDSPFSLWPLGGGQSPQNAYQHGMRNLSETVGEAQAETRAFITEHLAAAKAAYQEYQKNQGNPCQGSGDNKKNLKKALKEFGIVAHTLADMTSPSHQGWQLWDPTDIPESFFFHETRESTITPHELWGTANTIRQYYERTFR